jgi:hypothetical protein
MIPYYLPLFSSGTISQLSTIQRRKLAPPIPELSAPDVSPDAPKSACTFINLFLGLFLFLERFSGFLVCECCYVVGEFWSSYFVGCYGYG